jgi:colicin import membrane protein
MRQAGIALAQLDFTGAAKAEAQTKKPAAKAAVKPAPKAAELADARKRFKVKLGALAEAKKQFAAAATTQAKNEAIEKAAVRERMEVAAAAIAKNDKLAEAQERLKAAAKAKANRANDLAEAKKKSAVSLKKIAAAEAKKKARGAGL